MPQARQYDNLALVFQEALTAIERIRAGREKVADAESFRAEMRQQFLHANEEGRVRGYSREDIRLAMFAVIALLDESILNSRNPIFADWPRRPLQQEVFGGHQAGEIFFQNIDGLLAQPDSSVLADILEVYLLCILLGYGGKYSVLGKGELRAIADSMAERIRRIRGSSPLSPGWAPQGGVAAAAQGDPWLRWLIIAASGCLALALLLFVVFKVSLGSGVSGLS
ncbi:MAG TPA: DotU family type IV/VI secretion system protein [Bryobacteraceae bacterium]|nr:DotU family type IV/VI secretion system protein [Bryobacteraceae bacterium]